MTARDKREARAKLAYSGKGKKSGLPNSVQEALAILSYGSDFDSGYAEASKGKKKLQSKSHYKGLLARYYQNIAKANGWSDEDYNDFVKERGIPSKTDMEQKDLGVINRVKQGLGKMYGQTMVGVGDLAGTADNIQAERKEYVQAVKEKEALWKAYNAEVDFDSEGEMDLPWNIAGGFGETLPYFVTGVAGGIGRSTATSQLLSTGLADAAIDVARYQEHGDTTELGIDLATNIFPSVLGTKVANVFRRTPDSGPLPKLSQSEVRDAQTKLEGARLLKEGKVKIPFDVIKDPEKAAKQVRENTNPQRQIDINKAVDEVQSSAKDTYSEAMNDIGAPRYTFENEVPAEFSGNAIGYKLREYVRNQAKIFKDKAKPFKDKYEAAGANINLDISDLEHNANFGIKDKSARSKIQNAIKNIRDITEDAEFDITNITANELDDIIKQLNDDLYSNADSMSGKLTLKSTAALQEWMSKAKNKLQNLDPEFSDNYKQAKSLYSKGFNLVQEQTLDGKGSPIKGIEAALEDKTGKAMEDLFSGPDGWHNLLNMGKMLRSDDPLYGGIVRNYLEKNMSPDLMPSLGASKEAGFNMQVFNDSVQKMDWDALNRLTPSSKGIDDLKGLEGLARLTKTSDDGAFLKGSNAESSWFKKPGYFVQDVKDLTAERLKLFTPWYKTNKPTIGNKLEALVESTKAPLSREEVYGGPDALYKELKEKLDDSMFNLKKDFSYVDVNAPMLD